MRGANKYADFHAGARKRQLCRPRTVTPVFSVCIPSYNRSAKLEALLQSLRDALEDEGSSGAEVVVALDGSIDDSAQMLDRLASSFPVPLRHKWQPNRGLASARNAAAAEAAGEIVWFLDDDMVATAEALNRHRRWDRDRAPVLMGPSHLPGGGGWRDFYDDRWAELAASGMVRHPQQVSFANTSLPRTIAEIHRFDEQFVGYGFEDYELGLRLIDDGIAIGFDADAAVGHEQDRTGFDTIKVVREEGRNRSLFARLHPHAQHLAMDLDYYSVNGLSELLSGRGMHRPLWGLAVTSFAAAQLVRRPRRVHYWLMEKARAFAVSSGMSEPPSELYPA